MKKGIITSLIILSCLLALGQAALAYSIPSEFAPVNTPFGANYKEIYENDAPSVAVTILQILAGGLLYFAAPLAIIMIIASAFNMVINGADPEKVTESRKHLTWTVLGLITIMLSYTIVKVILNNALLLGGGASNPPGASTAETVETPPATPPAE